MTLTVNHEFSPMPGVYLVNCTVGTTGDTYASKLGKVKGVIAHDETTQGGANATFSGQTVTVTCTGGDVVDLLMWGEQ